MSIRCTAEASDVVSYPRSRRAPGAHCRLCTSPNASVVNPVAPRGPMNDNSPVTSSAVDWSPADNPYAIAVSEAQWWQRTAQLAVLRLRDPDDERISWFSSRQIDARQLVFALRQLLNAEQLEQMALEALGMSQAVRDALAQARQQFENALPGMKHMRDALMHFDEWSRGEGRGPQKDRVRAGASLREVASEFWGFAYDPIAEAISLGPYTIHVSVAEEAAAELSHAIYLAAHAVDRRNTAELRAKTTDALIAAGIPCDAPDAPLKISPGRDLKVWLSLKIASDSDKHEHRKLAERIIDSLGRAKLHLVSTMQPDDRDTAECLARGEALLCKPDA